VNLVENHGNRPLRDKSSVIVNQEFFRTGRGHKDEKRASRGSALIANTVRIGDRRDGDQPVVVVRQAARLRLAVALRDEKLCAAEIYAQ
jgi:hypothetical protein